MVSWIALHPAFRLLVYVILNHVSLLLNYIELNEKYS